MFDMSQCKKGDKLVCRNGTVAEFIGENKGYLMFHPHYKYEVALKILKRDVVITTTSEGYRFLDVEDQFDIIGFYKEEPKMIERDKEYDLKVTGEQLAILFFILGKTVYGYPITPLYTNIKNRLGVDDFTSQRCKLDGDGFGNAISFKNIKECVCSLFTKPETEEERNKRELLEEYEAAKKHFEELGKKLGVE